MMERGPGWKARAVSPSKNAHEVGKAKHVQHRTTEIDHDPDSLDYRRFVMDSDDVAGSPGRQSQDARRRGPAG